MKKFIVALLICISTFTPTFSQVASGGVKFGNVVPAFINDTFTAGSDVNLSSHTGETGATWTLQSFYSGVITNDSTLDRIYTTSGTTAYYASGTPPSANYCAKADFYNVTTISVNVAIAIRMSTSADTMILLRLNNGTVWEVIDRVATSNTTLHTSTTSLPSAGGAAVTAEMCANGTAVTVSFNGVQDTSLNSTTSISSTGQAGVRTSGASTSTTGFHLDNFSARAL